MPRKGRGTTDYTNGNVTKSVYSAGQILHTDVTDYLLGGRVTMRDGRVDKVLFEGDYCQAAQAGSSSDSFAFYYYNQDHLGNVREVVDATGTVQQVTRSTSGHLLPKGRKNYYPFGTSYCDSPNAQSPDLQPYKYNGKELDRMHGLDTPMTIVPASTTPCSAGGTGWTRSKYVWDSTTMPLPQPRSASGWFPNTATVTSSSAWHNA